MAEKRPFQTKREITAFRRGRNTPLKAELLDYLKGPMEAARVLARMDITRASGLAHLPRHIWIYWHDGWETAPEIAKLCLQSWIARNPGYDVRALDQRSLGDYLTNPPVHYEKTKLNSFANRVRLRLLRTHGGVWADATNFCIQPIDSWIEQKVSPARLFAYALPGSDRSIATWFLGATVQSPLVAAWEELVARYFEHIEREGRPVHAYFFMPYIFEFAVRQNPVLQSLWDAMPKEPTGDAGLVSRLAGLQAADQTKQLRHKARERIAAALIETKMQKLTWKGAMRTQTPAAREVLDLLRLNLQG